VKAGDASGSRGVAITEPRLPTRMGDGSMVYMTRSQLRADIEEATALAARKAKVEPLTSDEVGHVLDIYASTASFTAVDIGEQVVLSCDGGGSKMTGTDLLDLSKASSAWARTSSSCGTSSTRTRRSRRSCPSSSR
jgi:hypothetical protein